jgi:hypothetical protein
MTPHFRKICELIARGELEAENAARYLADLGEDSLAKALFCQAIAENYRRQWYAGQDATRATLAALPTKALRAQYGKFSAYDRKFIADRLWINSPREAELRGSEQMWSRWASMFSVSTTAQAA